MTSTLHPRVQVITIAIVNGILGLGEKAGRARRFRIWYITPWDIHTMYHETERLKHAGCHHTRVPHFPFSSILNAKRAHGMRSCCSPILNLEYGRQTFPGSYYRNGEYPKNGLKGT